MNLSCDYVVIWELPPSKQTMLCAASNDWGAEDLDTVIAHAARHGHLKIVILCHRWGVTNIEWAAICAEEGGTKKACKCVTSGPKLTHIDRANVRQIGVQICLFGVNFEVQFWVQVCGQFWSPMRGARLCRHWFSI